jgi:hypothetical protein
MATQTKRRFRAAHVAAATGANVATVCRYLDRRIVLPDIADIDPGGSGRHRMFGPRTAYRIALVHKLAKAGLAPAAAGKLAGAFLDTPQPGRPAGGLFPIGRTLLIASADGGGAIVNVLPDETADDAIGGAEVALVVDLGRIVDRVNTRLGLTVPMGRDLDAIINEFRNNQNAQD